ncbi:MAG: hypothetical protein GY895_13050 [Phycisphaera sp.]|nr:hypothetical protein [Phycisphaera sp.]
MIEFNLDVTLEQTDEIERIDSDFFVEQGSHWSTTLIPIQPGRPKKNNRPSEKGRFRKRVRRFERPTFTLAT